MYDCAQFFTVFPTIGFSAPHYEHYHDDFAQYSSQNDMMEPIISYCPDGTWEHDSN